ncbi:hypothetical protein ASPWEDRAFT_45414 [Aspergillus wentii DTO 134E9]|uniref:Uncharacterized protein n=1 Tax=Aspergillus wentii DTO 134E9 TaxID=1073089 RepID=A0A1L9R983_ASPWE|nr:uncharacterized protein ASPWEDRAFT_45414 [Aspergillus wentii DTO 134E9]OJJ31476.1 hypothetical protein ASPWEDRAFT_45414 [Aspergillus wentii DTO 134E9]
MDPTTNAMHIDVRTQARTPDGHGFYIRYKGIIKLDEKAKSVIGGGPNVGSTQFGDHEWFTTPILETSHPDLKWVEESVFVAQGRFVVEQEMPNAMEYRICRVVI